MARRALEGVKVVEFAYIAVTPLTVKSLAVNGAEVVRVESTTRLDPMRTSGPFIDGVASPEHSAEIANVHSDKYGVTLNLKHPEGLKIARRLVAWADIVADGFTTGVLEKLGLGYEELKKVKPDIIMFSCNTFGQTGPLASFPSTGIQLTGMTGFTEVSGWPERSPIALGYYTDSIVPYFNLITVLSALDYRRRTGKGQHIDLSQTESGLYFNAPLILDYVVNNRLGQRHGNRSPYAAPHGVFRCKGEDKWCAIAVFTDEEWNSFCQVIGSPAWTSQPQFGTLLDRKKNETELESLIERWTVNHSAHEVMSSMQAAGVPAGAVQNGEEVFNDPQIKNIRYFRPVYYPGVGKDFPTPMSVAGLSRTPAEVRTARPMVGEHNEYVYTRLLGLSDDEFTNLLAEGVFD
jgi:benzylsuccinate CoA-transferase BbsF subunit